MGISSFLNWLAGGSHHYMTLVHCMDHDIFWIVLTVALDLIVASGYVVIALHWRRNEATLAPSPARTALGNMKKIFVFCGLCGYVFIPIKMFWPAWRLYDAFLVVLAYYTWQYALGSRSLRVVYEELGRSAKLAEALEQSQEEGRRKSYFLNAISHDLKTPLNGLMLQAELAELCLNADNPEGLREALTEIKNCTQTTADLLNRFLEIGRIDWSDEPSVLTRVDLAALLEDVTNSLRAVAEHKNLAVVVDAERPFCVETDKVKLSRILFNLVDNAIKFTHQGEVRVVAEAKGGAVQVHVVDTGTGIAVEHQAVIFDDFTQVHNRERDSRKGFGLGLAIARRLARQIGGDLVVASELGRGSRFTIILPAMVAENRPGGPTRRNAALAI